MKKEYSVSLYGRFGHFVMLIVYLIFTPLPWMLLGIYDVFDNKLFLAFSIPASIASMFALFKILSFSPHFVITDTYIQINGMFTKKQFRWLELKSVVVTMAGYASPKRFMFLILKSGPWYKRVLLLDVSGLLPNCYALENDIRRHISKTKIQHSQHRAD